MDNCLEMNDIVDYDTCCIPKANIIDNVLASNIQVQ